MASTRPAAAADRPGPDDPLVAAIAARLPGLRVLAEPIDRESYRLDETPYLHPGLPRAVVFPTSTADVVELVRIAGELGVPIVPRGAGTGLSGRRRRDRGRSHDGLHRDGPDPRDRQGEPRRGRPAGGHQRPAQGGRRGRGPVLPARSGQLRDVLDRRQPRDECRRPVLRQVRPDARLGHVARGRDGRRHGHPDRRPERQGRRRLLADAPVRRAARARSRSRPRRRSSSGPRRRRG